MFRPDPLRPSGAPDAERVVFSGDLVRRDADGFLYFVSRKDRIIKTMGYRVGPDEVANVLYGSGEVAEAAVLGEPDEHTSELQSPDHLVCRLLLEKKKEDTSQLQ